MALIRHNEAGESDACPSSFDAGCVQAFPSLFILTDSARCCREERFMQAVRLSAGTFFRDRPVQTGLLPAVFLKLFPGSGRNIVFQVSSHKKKVN